MFYDDIINTEISFCDQIANDRKNFLNLLMEYKKGSKIFSHFYFNINKF